MAEQIIIRVNNWDKYQSEHRRNTYLWFKFYLTYFRHGKHLELGDTGTVLFLFFLCEAADQRSAQIKINRVIACAHLGWSTKKFDENKNLLISTGCISEVAQIEYEASRGASQDRIEKNRIEEKGVSPAETHLPTLAKIWNGNRGKLPAVKGCSKERKRKAEARFAEFPDPDYWRLVVGRIAGSRFCNGANDRGWRADFDFLIKPDTHNRVVEGKYDDKKAQVANVKTAAEILRD